MTTETNEMTVIESELNLYQRVNKIMEEVGWVEKRGKNTMQNYNYAQEADVTEACRKSMIKWGVVVAVNYGEQKTSQIVYGQGKTAQMFECVGEFVLINADKPEERMFCRIPGHALDSGDKAVWKCLTGIGKYFLMKTFMIPTGDDPEADNDTDKLKPEAPKSIVPPAARTALEGAGATIGKKEYKIYALRPGPEDHEAKILFDNSCGVGKMEFFQWHSDLAEANVYVSKAEGKSAAFKRCLVKTMTVVE